jgi:PmbA protein
MDILQQLQGRTEQAEVVSVRRETTSVEFESNRFKTSKVEETSGVAVRAVCDGRLGFSASSDEKATDRLLSNVLESAAFGEQVPLTFPGPQPAGQVATFDPTIAGLPVDRLVQIGQEIVDTLLTAEPAAQVSITLNRGVEHAAIRNGAGTDVSFRRSPLSMVIELTRVQGDDVLVLFEMSGTTAWDDGYLALARRIADKLRLARTVTTMNSGRMPVLLAPTAAVVLGLPLMEGLNGKNVFTGISPLAGKVGQALFDPKVSFVDDGTLDGRYGSAPYDDEGVPHRRNALVDRGVLQGFIYDLRTAAQSGTASTGNGSRGRLFSPPEPTPTNLLLAPGETPLAEMIAGIDEGLLVEDVLGLGQGNIISGAFSNPASLAFKIERGEIVGRVKDVSISGNVYEVLRDVAAVSRETLWVYQQLSLPYVLLGDMNVVAK